MGTEQVAVSWAGEERCLPCTPILVSPFPSRKGQAAQSPSKAVVSTRLNWLTAPVCAWHEVSLSHESPCAPSKRVDCSPALREWTEKLERRSAVLGTPSPSPPDPPLGKRKGGSTFCTLPWPCRACLNLHVLDNGWINYSETVISDKMEWAFECLPKWW